VARGRGIFGSKNNYSSACPAPVIFLPAKRGSRDSDASGDPRAQFVLAEIDTFSSWAWESRAVGVAGRSLLASLQQLNSVLVSYWWMLHAPGGLAIVPFLSRITCTRELQLQEDAAPGR